MTLEGWGGGGEMGWWLQSISQLIETWFIAYTQFCAVQRANTVLYYYHDSWMFVGQKNSNSLPAR